MKKLGPSLNTAMWGAVWEVSAAGPAPVNEGDQKLKDWIETVYINLAYYMDSMKVKEIKLFIINMIERFSYYIRNFKFLIFIIFS